VTESALPYFVCDQLLILVRANPLGWTWKQWAASEEMSNARLLGIESVDIVQARALVTLLTMTEGKQASERVALEKITTVSNTLRVSDGVTYDADISRAVDWHLRKVLLVRIISRKDGEKNK